MGEVEHTADGRWIVVGGRRWRATDPSIPEAFRAELTKELMAGRRGVAAGRRADDDAAIAAARERVQDAKVALGERGDPWWEPMTPGGQAARLRATTLALARGRAPKKTICPSDVARTIGGSSWRSLMDPTRTVVRDLATDGLVEVLQRGEPLDAAAHWRGPIRIRLSSGGGGGR